MKSILNIQTWVHGCECCSSQAGATQNGNETQLEKYFSRSKAIQKLLEGAYWVSESDVL
jgi:Fe-S cluster biogenesis protein NfuA